MLGEDSSEDDSEIEAPADTSFDASDIVGGELRRTFHGLSLTSDQLGSLSDAQFGALLERPQLSTLEKQVSATSHFFRWVHSFNIVHGASLIPGDDIHKELQSLERQYRESLYRILRPAEAEGYEIEAGNYMTTLSRETKNKDAISAAVEGSPNFVVARFGFVVKKANGETIYKHYPIKVKMPEGQLQDIYSTRSFTDKHHIRRFGSHTRDEMMLQHLSRRYALGTTIKNGQPTILDPKAQTLDSDLSHSEQALYLYLDTNEAKVDLVSRLQADLRKEEVTDFTIDQVVLDMHSTRYMCGHCQAATLGEQNSVQSDMFLGLLARKLNSVFGRDVVSFDGRKNAKLTMVSRVGASVKHGNMTAKTKFQHVHVAQCLSDIVISADMVTMQGATKLPEAGDLSEYTVFTSGGNVLTQQQILQLAYDNIVEKDQRAEEVIAAKTIGRAARHFLMKHRLEILTQIAHEKRLRKWIELSETVEELHEAQEHDLFGLTDDQYEALTPEAVQMLDDYGLSFSCFLEWAEDDADALQELINNGVSSLEDIFGKDDITEENVTACLGLGSDALSALLDELEGCEEYVFEDITLREFLSGYKQTREDYLNRDFGDECCSEDIYPANLALRTANRLNPDDSDDDSCDESPEESEQYDEDYDTDSEECLSVTFSR